VSCGSSNFGSAYPTSSFTVTNNAVMTGAGVGVSKIITPSGANQTDVCGNDIALLILSKNITIPQYVEPALTPALTDHKVWATTVTAIGYGISTPTDTNGTTAGTRRIKQNIGLACIPNDTTFVDCFSDPQAASQMTASEFVGGDGTCEGDSGSSAYDQTLFNNGTWASFGVLSRGGVSGSTCVGSIYSRFDAWASLIIDAANQAAQAGGYPPPAWAGGSSSSSSGSSSSGGSSGSSSSSGGSSGGSSSGSTTGKSDGQTCAADSECVNQNCVSNNGGQNFVCASLCGQSNSCTAGATCNGGYCFPDAPTSVSQHSGCAVAPNPTQPVPWALGGLALAGAVGLVARRRAKRG
jgi:MYXO-CTERM domain-containing protein